MAEGKKVFNAYADWIEIFEALPDENAGQLAKHIFRYVNDKLGDNEAHENPLVNMGFIPIKSTLKRDLKKYFNRCETNRLNGRKGGRPIKGVETQKTERLISKPKKADKDKDKDKDKDRDIKERKKETIVSKKSAPVFNFKTAMVENGFDGQLVDDWIKVRKTKKLTNTKTALKSFIGEVEKTGQPKNYILKLCVENSWGGFKASWDYPKQKKKLTLAELNANHSKVTGNI